MAVIVDRFGGSEDRRNPYVLDSGDGQTHLLKLLDRCLVVELESLDAAGDVERNVLRKNGDIAGGTSQGVDYVAEISGRQVVRPDDRATAILFHHEAEGMSVEHPGLAWLAAEVEDGPVRSSVLDDAENENSIASLHLVTEPRQNNVPGRLFGSRVVNADKVGIVEAFQPDQSGFLIVGGEAERAIM